MWLRDPIDIELTRNSQSPIGIQFYDDATDLPINIVGYSFTCLVGAAEGQGVLLSVPCVVTDPVIGAVDIAFDGAALLAQAGNKDVVTLAYQVLASAGGSTVTAMRGSIILTPGIR